ncbi:low specificity L-threonine aldolase [Paenibacillus sp. L3-i20]|uniref:threonine aldolase family protein n=1 Tax=Paenibacillus sp. L3-i20 TaxID=2905833 RepID=UPI001EDE41BC|nr:beta-eliminating lyase-related protein [Paenibacillus sp. L3-i20]GKU78026.1 hypothetical protein L3i20_v224230 [Paenibacillus sp. L3-i20]
MEQQKTLMEVYNKASYPLIGQRKRNMQVLKEVFEQVDGDLDSDIYGEGTVIDDFQERMASMVGKESAIFFPSGTMAQQIALRIWSDEVGKKKVAYHPFCHLELHEQDALKELHHLEPILLADSTRPVLLQDLLDLKDDVACVLLELPQREIGGQLPEYEELEKMSALCRERGIKLHMDGARLFEVLPYYRKSAVEVCALFDSVYISVYKGIGGIAGAVLIGDRGFTEKSKVWKQRHGGNLIGLYPYIVPADYYMTENLPKMEQFYKEAVELASYYNNCHSLKTLPEVPVSNMFHVHSELKKEELEAIVIRITEETGVGLSHIIRNRAEDGCFFEVAIGDRYSAAPRDAVAEAFCLLDESLRG